MRIVHVVASLNLETGGTARSVSRLADAQSELGLDVTVHALDYVRHGAVVVPSRARLVLHPAPPGTRWLRGWSPRFARALCADAMGADVIHGHGLWMQTNRHARQAASIAGVPLVVSARGMLEPWSLARSAWRKRAAWWAYERRNLERACAIHVTSIQESRAVRAVLPGKAQVLLPNGVDLPAVPDRRATSMVPGSNDGQRVLLFLSRLHPKKGLELLLDAWAALSPRHPAWRLVVAGTGEPAYEQSLRARSRGLGRVEFTGGVDAEVRRALYDAAELFVLPTHSENFGNVVAEALAHGCPVLTTVGAPWPELEPRGCGWSIPIEARALTAQLDRALALDTDTLRTMGVAGRSWMEAEFGWSTIATAWCDVYRWLARGASTPACVRIAAAVP